jgi:hypothetical protein
MADIEFTTPFLIAAGSGRFNIGQLLDRLQAEHSAYCRENRTALRGKVLPIFDREAHRRALLEKFPRLADQTSAASIDEMRRQLARHLPDPRLGANGLRDLPTALERAQQAAKGPSSA